MPLLYHGAGGRFNWILREVERMGEIPKDPVMLLSVVNTNLRDYYSDLDSFCQAKDVDKNSLIKKLSDIGYEYDKNQNQFK